MSITVSFVAVLALVLGGGLLLARRERQRGLLLADQAGSHRATWALARVEASRMAVHPAWLVTTALLTGLITVVVLWFDEERTVLSHRLEPYLLMPIVVGGLGAIVSAHRNVTRSRRHGTDELFGTTPTAPRARTAAHLLAALAPAPIGAVLGSWILVVILFSIDLPQPVSGSTVAPMFATALLALVGGGVVGVLLGRWWPFAAAPLLGIALLIWLNNARDHLHPRFRWLRVAVEADFGGRYDLGPTGWHIAFLCGLVGLGAVLAVARHGMNARLLAVLGLSAAVVVSTGWIMTRPPSERLVAGIVRQMEAPDSSLHCETRDDVGYCVDPEVPGWIDEWHPAVEHVLAEVPAARRPADLQIVMRPPVGSDDFLPEVTAALDPAVVWAPDGAIHPSLQLSEVDVDIEVAWQVAAAAVGLPPSLDVESPVACVAGGQARVVVAHWLAGRASARARHSVQRKAEFVRTEGLAADAVPMDFVSQWVDGSSVQGYLAVAGSAGYGADILAADELLDSRLGPAEVRANWTELTSPATPASRLFELAGTSPERVELEPPAVDHPMACP